MIHIITMSIAVILTIIAMPKQKHKTIISSDHDIDNYMYHSIGSLVDRIEKEQKN